MKKFVVLMLVLGLTTAGFADWSDVTANLAGGVLTFSGPAGDAGAYSNWFYALANQGVMTNQAVLYTGTEKMAGSSGAISAPFTAGTYSGVKLDFGLITASYDSTAGEWFTVDYTGAVLDVLTIYNSAETVTLGTVIVTPEPVTIALLGLGSLFIRRRK